MKYKLTSNLTEKEIIKTLQNEFEFPFDVIGLEDFNWEEYYVFGPGDSEEYKKLKNIQPSYRDTFKVLDIKNGFNSEWVIDSKDFLAHVQRISDNKMFYLGLSEIKTLDESSKNQRLLDDYTEWFYNNL